MMTTTYCDALLEAADYCPVKCDKAPASNSQTKTVAPRHFEMLDDQPDPYTLDAVRLQVFTALAQVWR